jgi:hypothetical protein
MLAELARKHGATAWFASDGMHPDSDLTLLDALLLFEQLH